MAIGFAVALTPPTLSARTGFPLRILRLPMIVAAVVLSILFPYELTA